MVIAASFDDVIAITGYSIFSSLAITGQSNVAWQIASGPLQVRVGGACARGCLAVAVRCSVARGGRPPLLNSAEPPVLGPAAPPCFGPQWQVVFGILGGLIAGLVLGCTRLFCTRYKRLVRGGPPPWLFLVCRWRSAGPRPWLEGCTAVAGAVFYCWCSAQLAAGQQLVLSIPA